MSSNKRKHAFTLAEIMIVLLVLTLLLAIAAPLITKRRTSRKGEELWRWSTRNYLAGPMDTYYNPAEGDHPSLFIGMTPDSGAEITNIYEPVGTVVVRGGYYTDTNNAGAQEELIQHQLHLRFGRRDYDDIGHYAGSLLSDNANILFGSKFEDMKAKQSESTYPVNNIAYGFNALKSISSDNANPPLNNVAIGHIASETLVNGSNNVTIGAASGAINASALNNTMIGYEAGFKTTTPNNTLIGYRANVAGASFSDNNVFIGAETGQQENFTANGFSYNTAIGYKALSSVVRGQYNIAIGAGALKNLQQGNYNVAIGYDACANLINQSHKTCIGYKSGPSPHNPPTTVSSVGSDLGMGIDDSAERTYIGAAPGGGYGGNAVLEIHNIQNANNASLINQPSVTSNTTTVINGNLVVMGKTYLTVGNILYPFSYENSTFGNLLGVNYNQPCSMSQTGYAFNSTTGDCQGLSNLTSDRRLKDIGSKFNAGLYEINQLKVYNFTFKNDKSKKKHTGVIAQELQKIFPNAVFKDEKGYLKIRWDEMFYASINAIKELNHKVTSLIKQATDLEAQIKKLEKDNQELKTKADNLAKRIEALKMNK